MNEKKTLYLVWTNADLITSKLMVFMYGINAKTKGWWENVTIVIWGATAKLVSENTEIQEYIKKAQTEGVHVSACITCANELGVADKLEALDIELIRWGAPLTELLKNDEAILTI
ncbi:MAG: DsrE family protein [Spirochaetales bacterium]|uniref:DsrE family protein n=1 Tax=Candidatus Thalassospirochaeta sargassi TaxID=3119039 RepID=A0AAJ1MPD5_9SPIO|nr:DsrE family protein [Spirochaetales bacterium]